MFGYTVKIDKESTYSNEEHDAYTNTLKGVYLKRGEYPDVVSTHEFKAEDHAWLVWIEWSTGNSFGRSYRSCAEALGLFKDKVSAKLLAKTVEEFKVDRELDYKDQYYVRCETPDGQVFDYPYACWLGYFETLEEVHCDLVEIEP